MTTDLRIEGLCEIMHKAYEVEARRVGWSTQRVSRVTWANLPEPNRKAMRAAVRTLLNEIGTK